MSRIALAALMALTASVARADPVVVPPRAALTEPDADAAPRWRGELLVALQPPHTGDPGCARGLDCQSATREFYATAVRATLARLDRWSGTATLAFGVAHDREDVPKTGFGIATLRLDLQLELRRSATRIGAAVRLSPVLAFGWSGTGSELRTDFPGFSLLIGRRDLWAEIGIPAFPTEADPRLFFLGGGWDTGPLELVGGFATFGSIGYQSDAIDHVGIVPGVWASARYRVAPRWSLTAQVALTLPFVMSVGVGFEP